MGKYYVVSYKQGIAHVRLALDFEVIKGEKLVFKPGSIEIEDK